VVLALDPGGAGSGTVVQATVSQQAAAEAARGCPWPAAWAADALTGCGAAGGVRRQGLLLRPVAEAAIQIGGGLGLTWECLTHLYLRRVLLDRRVLGDEDHHLTAIAGFVLDEPAAPPMAGRP
jgi:alkylation response protein AidB-like acyl-CoA dehydrogenase